MEQGGLKATWQEGGAVMAVCMPRATREDAGRTGPGAPSPQCQRKEKVAAIGNFKCPNGQRAGSLGKPGAGRAPQSQERQEGQGAAEATSSPWPHVNNLASNLKGPHEMGGGSWEDHKQTLQHELTDT